MGFVTANEHFFGLEGAGIVSQVGRNVVTVSVGDRVLVVSQGNGCFANRIRTQFFGVQRLPDWMSFEVRLERPSIQSLHKGEHEVLAADVCIGRCNSGNLLLHCHSLLD
jgi:hypothetical protein